MFYFFQLEKNELGAFWRDPVRLVERNGAVAGATCSPRFAKEVLEAFGKQLVDDRRLNSVCLHSAGPTAHFLELDTEEWQEDDCEPGKADPTLGSAEHERRRQSTTGCERNQESQN